MNENHYRLGKLGALWLLVMGGLALGAWYMASARAQPPAGRFVLLRAEERNSGDVHYAVLDTQTGAVSQDSIKGKQPRPVQLIAMITDRPQPHEIKGAKYECIYTVHIVNTTAHYLHGVTVHYPELMDSQETKERTTTFTVLGPHQSTSLGARIEARNVHSIRISSHETGTIANLPIVQAQ